MVNKKHSKEAIKPKLHPRNKHNTRYNFDKLIADCSDLKNFVRPNLHGDDSIDFANPDAVKTLNKALLVHHYNIKNWDIPEGYLCPPIPGRADYLHHIADLLRTSNYGKIPQGESIKCLDIGTGANCIYPILGSTEYGWNFIASDIDEVSINNAKKIVNSNPFLKDKIDLRLQKNEKEILDGIIAVNECFDLMVCNPPFHASPEDAAAGSKRKLKNLKLNKESKPLLNFGGKSNELWYTGGEAQFISTMVAESKRYLKQCYWFSSLVSKQNTVKAILGKLKDQGATQIEVIPMGQGNKTSRILAWTFLNKEEQKVWKNTRWNTNKDNK